ncbi:concanavalin A-like lectin/glucanase domain-containing protein [Thamnocephalis sphaerospora]|uniref:Concanavalin A-like lectin/glucanase domain-containing protein n=1 Tax=Thamnocephalis sphaerospora TaxID=78915 RepID=A0A4P9XIQ1_9FUNG|nr:concanavalin A-like lectin/glucanase domain-containing protein [Thamnocephalis sphaerospora]|eukprot:RKP05241.1 concanavalin A-like lectin/glucanase domain-containing protein [Thamnocephalis sphaerospora]
MLSWNTSIVRQPALLLLLLFTLQTAQSPTRVAARITDTTVALSVPDTTAPLDAQVSPTMLDKAVKHRRALPKGQQSASRIMFSDDFNGSTVNATRWGFDLGDGCDRGICGWGNEEKQLYVREAATCVDGHLRITALRDPKRPGFWTSARVSTKDTFTFLYGRIDVRARMPTLDGAFGAIWLLPVENAYGPWPKSGEIDVVEAQSIWKGRFRPERSRTPGTLHFAKHFNGDSLSYWAEGNDPSQWHTYTTIWRPDGIFYEIDGRSLGGYRPPTQHPDDWPFNKAFYLTMNLAIDPKFGSKASPKVNQMTMDVDWIRVSKL